MPDYPVDRLHRPIRGIPDELNHVMQAALGPDQNWYRAGRAFGIYVARLWPEHEAIDHLYLPLDELLNFWPNNNRLGYRIMTLAWLHIRFPDVIALVPRDRLFDFIEGAYNKHFNGKRYWPDLGKPDVGPFVYDPDVSPPNRPPHSEPLVTRVAPVITASDRASDHDPGIPAKKDIGIVGLVSAWHDVQFGTPAISPASYCLRSEGPKENPCCDDNLTS